MHRGLSLACCAVLVAGGVAATQSGARSGGAQSAKACPSNGSHRCKHKAVIRPKPDRHYGSIPRVTAGGEEYADFLTSPPPVRVAFGRTGLLFTCQPSGQQAFISGAWPLSKVKSDGTFGGRSNVVQAPPLDPLFENATSGTETWSGRFTSSTTGTLTLTVTGMGVPSFSPVGDGTFVSTPSTCAAGPKTFRFKIINPPRAPQRG